MARADRGGAQFTRAFQGCDPLAAVAIARVIIGAIHARIAREKNLFFGQPGETITMLCSGISEAIASLTPSLCCFGHFVLRKCSAFGWHSKIGNTVTENP